MSFLRPRPTRPPSPSPKRITVSGFQIVDTKLNQLPSYDIAWSRTPDGKQAGQVKSNHPFHDLKADQVNSVLPASSKDDKEHFTLTRVARITFETKDGSVTWDCKDDPEKAAMANLAVSRVKHGEALNAFSGHPDPGVRSQAYAAASADPKKAVTYTVNVEEAKVKSTSTTFGSINLSNDERYQIAGMCKDAKETFITVLSMELELLEIPRESAKLYGLVSSTIDAHNKFMINFVQADQSNMGREEKEAAQMVCDQFSRVLKDMDKYKNCLGFKVPQVTAKLSKDGLSVDSKLHCDFFDVTVRPQEIYQSTLVSMTYMIAQPAPDVLRAQQRKLNPGAR